MSGTVLVIGGAGYIGSQACKTLADKGYTPVSFDNYATGWRSAVLYGPAFDGDLRDRAAIEAAFDAHQPAAIMHFAALSLVGESMTAPDKYYENNVFGAKVLLDVMREKGAPPLVFSSTCAVYGDVAAGVLDEATPCTPISTYGRTKLAVEFMLSDYRAAFGFKTGAFRYFNVAGADPSAEIGELHEPETHLIPLALDAAAGARDGLKIFGTDYPTPDGTCIRDYIHVVDLIDAHVLGMEALLHGLEGFTCNLGTGTGYSVRDVLQTAQSVTGVDFPITETERRPGDPAKLVSAGTRALEMFGWRAERGLEAMVADAWRWRSSPAYAKRLASRPA
ncbi:MAG: UDP-glucose 4-epimerase GalE [Pseudomonadota bacterium]